MMSRTEQELRNQILAEQAGHQITYNHMKKKLRQAEKERDGLRAALRGIRLRWIDEDITLYSDHFEEWLRECGVDPETLTTNAK